MAKQSGREGQRWSVILAGGDGKRASLMVRRWLGQDQPKQYRTFIRTRSLFQHTLDRALRVTEPKRGVTVITRGHQSEVWAQLEGRIGGTVLIQPENRGEAAEIFFALTYIRACDPQATVVLYPSDHYVHPEDRFLDLVQEATWATECLMGRPVLLAARPDGPEVEYGWVEPGRPLAWSGGHPVREVRALREGSTSEEARAALASGGLWNTMVVAAKVSELWRLGRSCEPEMMALYERLGAAIGTPQETRVLEEVYEAMPVKGFSSAVLQRVPDQLAVMELSGVIWSDLGNPERVAEISRRICTGPASEPELLVAGGGTRRGL